MNGEPSDEEALRRAAYRALSYRWLTAKELGDKLSRRKGAKPELVDKIVKEFVALGYINEAHIAEDHILRGRERRLVGRRLLRFELIGRGIGEEIIDRMLEEQYPESEEPAVAQRLAAKKLRMIRGLDAAKRRRRLGGTLDRSGFGGEVIARIMEENRQEE